KLALFVRTMMSRVLGADAQPWQPRLLMREVLQPTEACRQMVHDYFRPHDEILLAILGEMLPAETTATRRQQIAFSIIGQCLFYRFAGNVVSLLVDAETLAADYAPEQLAEHIIDFSLAALGAKPPLSQPRDEGDARGPRDDADDETEGATIAAPGIIEKDGPDDRH
ncbi:MAG: CerR family C-terminal domain-containing protein, partial [Planctomycetaceae bacterium]